jgi:sulfite reductase (NADPH) flavoprotein alpha-component
MPEMPISSAPWNREHPYPARLLCQQRLTAATSDKDVRHIEIELGDSGLHYEPGDTLGIWIRNDPGLVAAVLAATGLAAAEAVLVNGKTMTLEAALLGAFELTQAHPGFVKHYAEALGNPDLLQLAGDSKVLRTYLDRRQIVDVLKHYPGPLGAQQLLGCLRHLTPRQYSIASSPLVDPRKVALTVNMVRYQQDHETRIGAASGFLGWRVHEGDRVPVFVVPNPNFRLPADPTTPLIMIGPGTGIAPFRAFLQHRAAQKATGDNWLFFGNPRKNADFLYEQELQAMLASGVLTRLDFAFSRDQQQKVYVQQRMLEQAELLFAWLQRGACVYVCGDARRMAEDVQQALLQIIAQQGAMDTTSARQYLVKLRQDKRYLRDVY